MTTGELWMKVPPTVRFIIKGELPWGVTSKDVILNIAGAFTNEIAQYKAVEFQGSAVEKMSIASHMTMANMGVEIGAKFALFAPGMK